MPDPVPVAPESRCHQTLPPLYRLAAERCYRPTVGLFEAEGRVVAMCQPCANRLNARPIADAEARLLDGNR